VHTRTAAAPRFDHRLLLLGWGALAALVTWLDYVTGPFLQFPFLFVFPVLLAGWYNGLAPALALALALPAIRLFFVMALWTVPWSTGDAILNAAVRVAVLGTIAVLSERTARQARALSREVRMLEGLLPICAYCKKIRDDAGRWLAIESYIGQRTEARFSHGICPDCERTHLGALLDDGPAGG